MLSTSRSNPVYSPAPGVIPETIQGPATDGAPIATSPSAAPGEGSVATGRQMRRGHSRRKAHRARLHAYAIVAVALVVFLIALAASNTARVNVSWVFGSSRVSLVWLVLFAAIAGWLLGLVATGAFHWRTRAPRGGGGGS